MHLNIIRSFILNHWIFILSLLFVLINSIAVYLGFNYLIITPVLLFFFYLAIYKLDTLIFIIVFFVPISIPVSYYYPNLNNDFFIPTEPLIFGIMVLFFLKLSIERKIERKILLHPLSIVIYFNLFWILITSLSSTMFVVSIKFFLVRLWYVTVFYFITAHLFSKFKNFKLFIWLYVISLFIVITYFFSRLSEYGLQNQIASNWIVKPFYNDHTSYGAALAMLFPVLIGLSLLGKKIDAVRFIKWIVVLFFTVAIIFSYTRAAWVSLLVAFIALVLIISKIKLKYLLFFLSVVIAFFIINKNDIFYSLQRNNKGSSNDFVEHLKSISNISSDQSNLERINRWNSAIKMFYKKPLLGWGPGTYMFQYAPFQACEDHTSISTNAGTGGNAHSEYLGPLAESGILGILSFGAIVVTTIFFGVKSFNNAKRWKVKILSIMIIIGLITYYCHGFLNNFLDTDKLSVLFWGFTAMIVALDVYHNKSEEPLKNN